MTDESRHVSVRVPRPAAEVYAYASDPAHLPEWAAGLASGVVHDGDRWFADSPMGRVELRFAPPNDFGVLDHDVVEPDGTTTSNPMRVVPAPGGSEVIFTVRRRGMSDAELERDVAAVHADLEALARVVESRATA
ncbi:polyketide cyclase [Luteimicrobium album]|uniref:Polyketide cyclase n=1 Tax=Luteimicrobium album TaxID=1054550 RepID=A0ABQ6HZL5_9MICO|nr:SRPBCC family protein [Luteimicrobium album]GMA23832.1 polyketide cyclase [Luteimicrobium album]